MNNPYALPEQPTDLARFGELEVWPDMHAGEPGDYDADGTDRQVAGKSDSERSLQCQ